LTNRRYTMDKRFQKRFLVTKVFPTNKLEYDGLVVNEVCLVTEHDRDDERMTGFSFNFKTEKVEVYGNGELLFDFRLTHEFIKDMRDVTEFISKEFFVDLSKGE